MTDTKENILMTALRLFAADGYEAVSVSDIAGALSMTKGALYRHYKSKKDIFDSIISRMFELDAQRAQEHDVPQDAFEEAPEQYRQVRLSDLKEFAAAQLDFWTKDEFALNFRRMITLEQYRNTEMNQLYQDCIVSGPVSYIEDIMREMMAHGSIRQAVPKQLAVEFFAPLFLLISMSDGQNFNLDAKAILEAHIERFVENYAVQ